MYLKDFYSQRTGLRSKASVAVLEFCGSLLGELFSAIMKPHHLWIFLPIASPTEAAKYLHKVFSTGEGLEPGPASLPQTYWSATLSRLPHPLTPSPAMHN